MAIEKIKEMLSDYTSVTDITPETTFEELGIDSLDTVELIMGIEAEFDCEIETGEDIKTVGDLLKQISAD